VCCIFLILVFLGPRAGILLWWLGEPGRWDDAFDTFFWPFLGFVFLPWTTLMYVGVAPGGVAGFDWLWLALSLLADLAMYAGGAARRDQVPGYSSYASRYGP
jgi:hypothetical protein